MNRQIIQLFGISMLLFAVLIGVHVALVGVRRRGAEGQTGQPAPADRGAADPRGLIKATDGTVLARSVRQRRRATDRIYRRTYPTGPLFSHAVGYSFISRAGRASSARATPQLTGEESEFGTIFSQLQGESARART